MLAMLVLLQSPIEVLDALAQKRDVAAIVAHSAPSLANRFEFLKHNGTYDTGRFGWHAYSLTDSTTQKQYVVFSTKLTSEDIGDQVFEWDGTSLTNFVPEDNSWGAKITHHEFNIRFSPQEKKGFFADRISLQTDAGRGSVMMRLSSQYRVSGILNENGGHVTFAQAGGVVICARPSTPTITLTYQAVVDAPLFAGSISADEAFLTNDYWYPMIARGPATYRATIDTPNGWTAIAQGVQESAPSGETIYRMDIPTVYFSLSAAPYRHVETTIGGRDYITWSTTMTDEQMAVQNRLNASVIDFYDKTFATYPFPRWGSLVSKVYGGGALEAYSFATYGTGWLPAVDPHEPSHTWWGGIIPNSYLHSMWNESFAVFSEGLYERNVGIGNKTDRAAAFVSSPNTSAAFKVASCEHGEPILGSAASSLGYGKGAMVLEMLESELGTATMIACLRDWLKTHKKGENGEWSEFENVVARVTKKDYKWFFDEWIRRTGWADFEISNVRWRSGKAEFDAHFKGESYRFSCEVMVQGKDGVSQIQKVLIDGDGRYSFACPSAPSLVSFDPAHKLLRNWSSSEAATSIATFPHQKVFIEKGYEGWAKFVGKTTLATLPANLDGCTIVGSPKSAIIARICRQAGFKVARNQLSWQGTTIDLKAGSARAVVDLPNGGHCMLALGETKIAPTFGQSRIALTDELGRFVRGKTDLQTRGPLAFRL